MSLYGARVLLTGATGGIGRAMASSLSQHGIPLLLSGRCEAELALLAAKIQDTSGVSVGWCIADLGNADQIHDLAQCAQQWDCNAVVHCAGMPAFGSAGSIQADDLYRVMHINLMAPMLLTQWLLPHLHSCTHAQIVFVGSVLGAIGIPGNTVYSASKFGLRGYAEALRRELGHESIKVKYLGPRATETEFNTQQVQEFNRLTKTHMDQPAQVARALVSLMAQDTPEMFLGFPEQWAVRINGAWPTLLDSAFHRHREIIRSQQELSQSPLGGQ